MRAYIIHVRLRENSTTDEKVARYAVLSATATEALEAVSGGLAFGERASLSDETLSEDQAVELGLVAGKTCMLE